MAQPRTKARRFKKFVKVYTPDTADDWKMIVRNEARRAWEASGDTSPWTGPLCVNLTFYFPRPKSHFNSRGELKPTAPKWHTGKPDRDNLDKSVLDALTNLGLWADDKQVCDGRVRKLYGDTCAGCEIHLREAEAI